ncbi:hypothetical protein DPMN_007406 [Dreissena polymorpha]|uniref:Uncharacterized protein n=1 Tax=Dreissena polymorpha TaxID=45954 RepID=A0A9D4MXB4_DREPO|nr:hypothetical protein DPMN_007406 [Dreissena polymorpha]
MMQVFFTEDSTVKICSTVLRPAPNPACSLAHVSPALLFSRIRMIRSTNFLGRFMRLIVRLISQNLRVLFFSRGMTSDWVHSLDYN